MPYFDDDGTEVNPELYPKPYLCIGCARDSAMDELENILCTLTRLDQRETEEFICLAFIPLTKKSRRSG